MILIGRNARSHAPSTLAAVVVTIFLGVFMVGGCETMSGPTPPQIQTVDYGAFPDGYEALAQSWVRDRTGGDGYAVADVQVTEPERGWYRAPVALRGVTTYGYKSFVSFSTHDQPGDLLSRHRYLLVFRDGRIALARPADDLVYLGEDG